MALSSDGRSFNTNGLQDNIQAQPTNCLADSFGQSYATHCLYMTYVEQGAVVSTGTCYYPSNLVYSSETPTAQMLRGKGVVCDPSSDGGGMASDGSFAYSCCTGDGCNHPDNAAALDSAAPMMDLMQNNFMPNCTSPKAQDCAAKYAHVYGCHITHVPLSPEDPCSPFVWGSSCLAQVQDIISLCRYYI
jgi:hypothetical protein